MLFGGTLIGPKRRAVALTFDDGPSAEHTPAILDELERRGARATFFALGRHVEAQPELARRIAHGHELAIHSFDHERGTVADRRRFADDVRRCRDLFMRVTGRAARLYRFPWGDPGVIRPADVAEQGLEPVLWTFSSHDDTLEADAIVRRVDAHLEPGAIVLLHDALAPNSVAPRRRDATVQALPAILDLVAARRWAPVTVSELLA